MDHPTSTPSASMIRGHVPCWPLSEWVHLFWWSDFGGSGYRRERVMPDGSMQMVFNLKNDVLHVPDGNDSGRVRTLRGALVSGVYSRYFVIDTAAAGHLLGIHFKPGGAAPFLGCRAHELRDLTEPLDCFWGDAAENLRIRLAEVKEIHDKFRILEAFLLTRLGDSWARHPAVGYALRRFYAASGSVAGLCADLGLSERWFSQVFRESTGLPPKLFSRLARFHGVLRRIQSEIPFRWADLAQSFSYFDQAHFVKEFRAFAGLSPTAYLARPGRNAFHLPQEP